MRSSSQILRPVVLLAILLSFAIATFEAGFAFEATPQTIPPDTIITLERTPCYGLCPEYKITITADGGVTFEGGRFVKNAGTEKSTISTERVRELLAAFEKINYYDLRDRYEGPRDGCKQWMTDHPTAVTSIRTKGRSKSVRHYYGCRGVEVLAELEKLEQAIDIAVNSEQWIR